MSSLPGTRVSEKLQATLDFLLDEITETADSMGADAVVCRWQDVDDEACMLNVSTQDRIAQRKFEVSELLACMESENSLRQVRDRLHGLLKGVLKNEA